MGFRKYRPLKPREVRKVLKDNNFILKNTVGSHAQWEGYVNLERRVVTLPDYNEYKDIDLIKSIISQSGLGRKAFYKN